MTKKHPEALVSLFGGPLDGRTLAIDSHESRFCEMDGFTYERTDSQLGDYRVYRYAPEEGSAPAVEIHDGATTENLLERDLDQFAAAEKKTAKKS
jgi:hypothetical protein